MSEQTFICFWDKSNYKGVKMKDRISMTGYYDNHIKLYSKESNTTVDKLPQIIWS